MSPENMVSYKALINGAGSYEIYQTGKLSEMLGILEADLAEFEKQMKASGPVEKLQTGISNYWTVLSNLLAQFHLYQLKWDPSQNWLFGEKVLRILLNITVFHRTCSKEQKAHQKIVTLQVPVRKNEEIPEVITMLDQVHLNFTAETEA